MNELILKMKGIDKMFFGVHALKGVDFDLKAGEIHALMGENGAGKSTLMKVLVGMHIADKGSIDYFGEQVQFKSIAESQLAGISIIHQELNMMNHLTVAQNIYIGRESMNQKFIINDKQMETDATALFAQLGMNIDPSMQLGRLTVGKQQMVEIAKAVSRNCKMLVLDEPTAALTETEVNELFKIMADFKAKGIGMIYISHRMDEIKKISDRITVMRDGEYVGTLITKDTTNDSIVKMMVGRTIYTEKKEKNMVAPDAEIVLSVAHLCSGNAIKDVSFELKKGEILGFSGLMGAGRTEVARAIFGADVYDSGVITLNGKVVEIRTPEQAVKHGICYLSEDRKRYGLLLIKSVSENTGLASIDKYSKLGVINDKKIATEGKIINDALKTKTPSMEQVLKNLSGGNQQKVIVARWLMKNSDIFIFDEPTRGIDVGAKSEMYALIQKLAKGGKSIIVISSEMAEVQRVSDRVVCMCEGRITKILDISEATQEKIMHYATLREGENK